MKLYMAGKITGYENYRDKFEREKQRLEKRGYA